MTYSTYRSLCLHAEHYEGRMHLNTAGQRSVAKSQSSKAVITQLPGLHAEHPLQHQLEHEQCHVL